MLPLVSENDPILKLVMPEFDFTAGIDTEKLVYDMIETMRSNNGIGLAAPQCGLMHRVFVMDGDKPHGYFNPEILTKSGTVEMDVEGCLSFPDLWLKIYRDTAMEVSYQDFSGKMVHEKIANLIARVYSHELDHLNGIRFVDQVGPLALKLAKSRRFKKKEV
jgi:peptide deformylase